MTVSILIPAYNAGEYIGQCLDSVCRQTYRDIQIVVVDDGSTDNTLEILHEYAENDSRIEIHSRPNKGVAETRNELITYARGIFSLFVDSDDWIEPDMVRILSDMAIDNSAQIAMCSNVDESSSASRQNHDAGHSVEIWRKDLYLRKFLQHRQLNGSLWNKLVATQLYKQIKFDPQVSYGEDAMVMWDVLNHASEMAVTTKELYHYRMNPGSISHQRFSEAKMSVITVWQYISGECKNLNDELYTLSMSRFGAEISLLLLEAAKNGLPADDKKVYVLRTRLKQLFPYMLKNGDLSWRFLTFAFLSIKNWRLVSLTSRIKL